MKRIHLMALAAAAISAGFIIGSCTQFATSNPDRPMLALLTQFENAPASGPAEAQRLAQTLPGPSTNPATAPAHWPGAGLSQHPFLFYGEGNNTLFVINNGKVIWSYNFPKGGEIDDAWMLSTGNLICCASTHCYEVTPQKKIVWQYDSPTGTQIHALQPIGLDKVMVVENGLPPHLYILNKSDNSKFLAHELPAISATDPKTVHTQFRNCRITAQGTFLLPFLKEGRIVEYDKDWKQIWEYKTVMPWSAVRLKNGNTLIPGDNQAYVREVNPEGKIVWSIEKNDLPGITLRDIQTANRLANGNTVFCNRSGSDKANKFNYAQVIEVTPDKKVVWVLQDFTNLTSASGIQLLDEPSTPETPGDLQR